MCGILIKIGPQQDEVKFLVGLDKLGHRGPDASGYFSTQPQDLSLEIGHRRLAIIDLNKRSNQPMTSNCERYVLSYNGEIYNYKSLKEQYLCDDVFYTSGDTEVLLRLLIKEGSGIIKELDGIFAFAFYDKATNELLVARDHLGVKPLYFSENSDSLVFASEIPAIFELHGKQKLDSIQLNEFLALGFVQEPKTGFRSISKVPAGKFARILITKSSLKPLRFEEFWRPGSQKDIMHIDLSREIKNSISNQSNSDVQMGLYFSGGVDSSLLLALSKSLQPVVLKASKKNIIQSGFEDDFIFAKQIAEKLKRNLIEVDLPEMNGYHQFLKEVEEVAKKMPDLISDFTFFASETMARATREMGFTVMLSGMGADEIFGGYPRYLLARYWKYRILMRPFIYLVNRKKRERLKSFIDGNNFIDSYWSLIGYFSAPMRRSLLGLESVQLPEPFKCEDFEKLSYLCHLHFI